MNETCYNSVDLIEVPERAVNTSGVALSERTAEMRDDAITPIGFCQCGCGQRTPIVRHTDARRGVVRGEPCRYVVGHSRRRNFTHTVEDRGYLTPCHIWQGTTTHHGYGLIWIDGRYRSVHIVAWERANGSVPAGKQLDHLCRVRLCINEDHLEPVTCAENVRRGKRTKLTADQVRQIRALVGTIAHQEIAERFGISYPHVCKIIKRERWADVGDDSTLELLERIAQEAA